MIISYNNNVLNATDKKIVSADTIIRLTSDIDTTIFGILVLYNGAQKVVQFIKEEENSNKYIARLIIDEQDIPYLGNSKFHLELINNELSQSSNIIKPTFDISLIKTNIKQNVSNEYKELVQKIAKLEEKITFIKESKILDNIKISNKDYIKKGMIPVAMDDNGNFVATYPFSNHVTSVNGQVAANGAVIIDASMIKYVKQGKSLDVVIENHVSAIEALNELLSEVISNQRDIRNKLDELDIKLTTHINSGIV